MPMSRTLRGTRSVRHYDKSKYDKSKYERVCPIRYRKPIRPYILGYILIDSFLSAMWL